MDLQLPGPEPKESALDRSFRERGRFWTWGMITLAAALAVWMFRPRPYWPPIIAAACLPWLACWVVVRSRGIIALSGRRGSSQPNVALPIFLPVILLVTRAKADWHIADWGPSVLPIAIGAGLAAVLAFLFVRRVPGQKFDAAIFLFGFGVVYGAALVVFINCGLDHSPPYLEERAVVTGQRVYHGKSTSYYLTLSRWNGAETEREIGVRSAVYSAHPVHSVVALAYYSGTLGVPWFRIK